MDVTTRERIKKEFKEIFEKPHILDRESLEELYQLMTEAMDYLDGLVSVLRDECILVADLENFVRKHKARKAGSKRAILESLVEEFDLDTDFDPYLDKKDYKLNQPIEDPLYGFFPISESSRFLLDKACNEDEELAKIVINEAIYSYFKIVVPAKMEIKERGLD